MDNLNKHTLSDSELVKKHTEMFIKFSEIRGRMISHIATLEMFMNIFLTTHFSEGKERQNELLETVFATHKITFESKRDIISCLMDKPMYKDYNLAFNGIKSKKGKKGVQGINHLLINLAKQRNVIAHCIINSTAHGIELFDRNIISFLRFTNDSHPYNISKIEFDEMLDSTTTCNKFFQAVIEGTNPTQ